MKKYLLLLFLINCSYAYAANQVDSLKNLNQVYAFINAHFSGYAYDLAVDTTENRLDDFDIKIADSLHLNVRERWLKTDLNGDGKTDLVVLGINGVQEIFTVVSDGDTFFATSGYVDDNHGHSKNYILPKIVSVKGEKAIILYHYYKKQHNHKSYSYYNFGIDTIVFKYGEILPYSRPANSFVERIEMDDNGNCEGHCPIIHLVIDMKKMTGEYSIKYHQLPFRNFEGNFSKEEITNIEGICNYIGFSNVSIYHDPEFGITDQTTTTWKFTYNNGKIVSIVNDHQGDPSPLISSVGGHILTEIKKRIKEYGD